MTGWVAGPKRRVGLLRQLLVAMILLASFAGTTWAAPETIKIGVLAFRPKDETLARWQPTADYLSTKLDGYGVRVVPMNFAELEQAVLAKDVDLVLTNPAHYVVMSRRTHLLTLASLVASEHGQPVDSFGGVIVVLAKRADLQTIADLKDKTIATPDRQSLGGFMMQAYLLKQAGLTVDSDYRVMMTAMPHDAAFLAMLDGRADAAFVRTGVLEALVKDGKVVRDRVRVINPQVFEGFPYATSTRLYPEWSLSALPHLDRDLARQIAAALFLLPRNSSVAKTGQYDGWTLPADYLPVREVMINMRIPPFDNDFTFTTEDVIDRYSKEWAPFLLLGVALALATTLLVLVMLRLGTERRRSLVQMEERKRLLASLGEGVFGVDGNNRCTFVNPAAIDTLGYDTGEILGERMHEMIHGHTRDGEPYPVTDCPVNKTLKDGKARKADNEWLLRKDGTGFPAAMTITPMIEGDHRAGAVVVFRDLTEQKRLESELLRLATTDFLTGLPNRRRFIEQLDLELARVRRGLVSSVALLMLDLDHFKAVNDHHGHPAGDSVLQHFSALLRESLRRVDTAGRLGGEEFAVILAGSSMDNARTYAERLREQVAQTSFRSGRGDLHITVSIGVTVLSDIDTTSEAIVARADLALYRAKSSGRNRVEMALPPAA